MIEISRSDIVSDYHMELTPEVRFIKLPIEGYLDLLNITPNSSQTAIINAINNPKYRFVLQQYHDDKEKHILVT